MPKDPLDDLHARTKESIRKASKTIAALEPAQSDTAAAPKKVVEVCLTCGTLAVHVLKALGTVYPMCSEVADVLSAAIQMEQGREENDVRIVTVYIELADFICELKLVKSYKGSITERFNQSIVRPMEDLLRRFSEFSGKYYGPGTASRFRRLQTLCRNILSADKHQKDLDGFLSKIINLRIKLNNLLTIEIATTLNKKLHKFITSQTAIERAIGGYGDIAAQRPAILDRKELEELFQQHLTDPILSQLFREENIGRVLRSTLDEWKEMDKQNKEMFDLKFNFVLDKFTAETKYLRDWLKKQADEGPHNIIPDPNFQKIWLQTAGKRSSVKRRQFIDGLSHYFALEMKRAEAVGSPADSWTTDIICSVPYHAAICDAIDRDASGYISVSEVVVFLQQKPQTLAWTNLQWLAYCAYGWHADNLFYSKQLDGILSRMPKSGAYYEYFQHFEIPLRAIQGGLQPLVEDLTPWAAKNMDEMIQQRRAWITKRIKDGLTKSFYRLECSMVDSIAGGDQIEWWFFPVAFVLFSYHENILSGSKDNVPEHFLEDARTSFQTLFETYDARVTELKRIWRRLPGDIFKAMKYYANGLFAHYFTVFNVPQVPKIQTSSKVKFISDGVAPNNPRGGEEALEEELDVEVEIEYASRLPLVSQLASKLDHDVTQGNHLVNGKSKQPVAKGHSPFASRLPLVSRRDPSPDRVGPNNPPSNGKPVVKVDSSFVSRLPLVSKRVSSPESDRSSQAPARKPILLDKSDKGPKVVNARNTDGLIRELHVQPTLVLLPLDSSFQRKHLPLDRRIKLGREIMGETAAPEEENGIFASQAVSKVHAEVWHEAGKVYIKDLKSRNGTFVNGRRLSPEGVKSKTFELKSGDTLHLGIDIKAVRRVSARVYCIVKPDDVEALMKAIN